MSILNLSSKSLCYLLLRCNDASLQNELLEVIKSHGLIGLIQMEDIILAEPEIEIGATFAVPQTWTLQLYDVQITPWQYP